MKRLCWWNKTKKVIKRIEEMIWWCEENFDGEVSTEWMQENGGQNIVRSKTLCESVAGKQKVSYNPYTWWMWTISASNFVSIDCCPITSREFNSVPTANSLAVLVLPLTVFIEVLCVGFAFSYLKLWFSAKRRTVSSIHLVFTCHPIVTLLQCCGTE